jgi:ATP-dependent Clp protease protease subunit
MDSVQIVESASSRMAVIDLQSKLLQSNLIFITDVITADSVATYQAELLYLASKMTPEDTQENPIKIYINSPGGECYSFFGLYDIMQNLIKKGYIIETCNVGCAASAAAMILLSGSKGHRFCMPNSTVMVHQPSSGTWGKVTDMENDLKEDKRVKESLNKIVKKHASEELVEKMERDYYLTPEEAKKFNIIDEIKE